MSDQIAEKNCKTCKAKKELKEFYKHKTNADGRQTECIDCYRSKQNERAANKHNDPFKDFYFKY